MAKKAKPKVHPIAVEIQWDMPPDMVASYANHMLVQMTLDECILSFFNVPPPQLPTKPEARAAAIKRNAIQKVKGQCVSKVVIPLSKIPAFRAAFERATEAQAEIAQRMGKGKENGNDVA